MEDTLEVVAIIDFETTGLSLGNGDRATKIAAVLGQGGQVVDQYKIGSRFANHELDAVSQGIADFTRGWSLKGFTREYPACWKERNWRDSGSRSARYWMSALAFLIRPKTFCRCGVLVGNTNDGFRRFASKFRLRTTAGSPGMGLGQE